MRSLELWPLRPRADPLNGCGEKGKKENDAAVGSMLATIAAANNIQVITPAESNELSKVLVGVIY